MIEASDLAYRYAEQGPRVLSGVNLEVARGETLLVVGPSGAGKSTLLRCLNGLVPHFHGGVISGTLRVGERDPVEVGPGGMSDLVAFVFQEPEAQFVAERVEDEVAFALENRGWEPRRIASGVREVLDALGISGLRRRRVATLSGGERQRVALASALATRPEVLVLDEPTSQLDPRAGERLLELLEGLHRAEGLTVVLSEHRIERVAAWADRVCWLPGDERPPRVGAAREVLAAVPGFAPPVLRLGLALGWDPPPLTVKEGRAFLAARSVPATFPTDAVPGIFPGIFPVEAVSRDGPSAREVPAREVPGTLPGTLPERAILLEARDLGFAYSDHSPTAAPPRKVLDGVSLRLAAGERIALMGPNGCGKSTLLKLLVGLLRPDDGRILLARQGSGPADTREMELTAITATVGFVPQNPARLLFQESLAEEIHYTRTSHGLPPAPTVQQVESPETPVPETPVPQILARFDLAAHARNHPFDLSTGERQRAALAAILAAEPRVLLLDEPTRGIDPIRKAALAEMLTELSRCGVAVMLATHDVELVARWADRVVVLEAGRLVEDGSTVEVLTGPTAGRLGIEPQIHRLLPGSGALTEQQVLRSRSVEPSRDGSDGRSER